MDFSINYSRTTVIQSGGKRDQKWTIRPLPHTIHKNQLQDNWELKWENFKTCREKLWRIYSWQMGQEFLKEDTAGMADTNHKGAISLTIKETIKMWESMLSPLPEKLLFICWKSVLGKGFFLRSELQMTGNIFWILWHWLYLETWLFILYVVYYM